MQKRRVVITGTGAVSPFGKGAERMLAALGSGQNGVTRLPEPAYAGDNAPQVAGVIRDVDISDIPRKHRRCMSPMSGYTFLAAREALEQADLPEDTITGGRLGLSIGSTVGSIGEFEAVFQEYLPAHSMDKVKSMMFFKLMSHSVAANVSQALGVSGRVLAAASACSSGLQSIGLGYEAVAYGMQDYMLCGGADEYHPLFSATFDIMAAASRGYNDAPERTPRPFDRDRDGVVCAEGAGLVLLETPESARERGAEILGEITGFATIGDHTSMTSPDPQLVRRCMQEALDTAALAPSDIDYINAHATGTLLGDAAESQGIAALFGDNVPVSGLKGYMGHTMAASGALETIACLHMLREGLLLPTLNLENIAEECSGVRHLTMPEIKDVTHILKNSFAFGGINCSLILRRNHD